MIKKILLYLWQLPQNLLGLLFLLFIRGEERHSLAGISFYFSDSFPGGISLGQYIIYGEKREKGVRHEYGHCLQSKMLGPLYLLVVGLPSLLHAALCKCKNHSYYDGYPENWADKLGKVKR
jgi:hypothetical protein